MPRKDREVIDLEEVTAVINTCECCRLGFVDEKACKFSFLYHCVMGSGNLKILENTSHKIYGLNQIMKHYAKNEVWEYD